MSSAFLEAAAKVKNLKSKPTNEELLEIYGLYKQATIGDVNTSQPFAVELKTRSKWDAWKALKGMSREDAERNYINKANDLIARYN